MGAFRQSLSLAPRPGESEVYIWLLPVLFAISGAAYSLYMNSRLRNKLDMQQFEAEASTASSKGFSRRVAASPATD